jgi:hypothetical protein
LDNKLFKLLKLALGSLLLPLEQHIGFACKAETFSFVSLCTALLKK